MAWGLVSTTHFFAFSGPTNIIYLESELHDVSEHHHTLDDLRADAG